MPAGESSSSVELSSPPKSPESPGDAIVLDSSSKPVTYPDLTSGVKNAAASSSSSKTGEAQPADQPAKAPRKKRGRAAATSDAKADATEKAAKVPRKPRQTRKKAEAANNNPPVLTGDAASTSLQQQPQMKSAAASRQPKITDLVSAAPTATATPPQHLTAAHSPPNPPISTPATLPIGNAPEAIPRPTVFKTESTSSTPTLHHLNQSPRSGQTYDPIRASAYENPRPTSNAATPLQNSPVKATNRASASPSISSLIDPPSTLASNSYSYNASSKVSPSMSHAQPHLSPSIPILGSHMAKAAPPTSSPKPSTPSLSATKSALPTSGSLPAAMDIDTDAACPPPKSTSRKPSIGTNNSSKAPSPKPPRKEKEKNTSTPPLPPLPGSGTLSATLFGAQQSETTSAPTVILEVKLEEGGNKYVNFARLAEQQYGFNALHPRLAAQKERLARVAAAGAALENAAKANGASADEMSLDLSEGENDMSNVEMGGTGTGAGSAAGDGEEKPMRKKRRMKEDQYDKGDPFVDDSELAWEEQQAASKDGFFVYSGPLVPEGEVAKVERADGTIVKPPGTGRGRGRGRGRGGGPGSRGGRGGGGPGSRGGQTTRKPRMSKADRVALELQKADRERPANVLLKPSGYDAAAHPSASTSSMTQNIGIAPAQGQAQPMTAPGN